MASKPHSALYERFKNGLDYLSKILAAQENLRNQVVLGFNAEQSTLSDIATKLGTLNRSVKKLQEEEKILNKILKVQENIRNLKKNEIKILEDIYLRMNKKDLGSPVGESQKE